MGTFVHQELHTQDPDAAKDFYRSVFGWSYQDVPMPEGVYAMILGPDGGLGGINRVGAGGNEGWLGYVGVPSVEATIAKIEDAGGRVILGKTEVPGMGWFAWFEDPNGARLAAWEPLEPPPAAKPTSKKKAAKKAPAKKKAAKKAPAKKTAAKKAPPKAPPRAKKARTEKGRKAAKKKAGKKRR